MARDADHSQTACTDTNDCQCDTCRTRLAQWVADETNTR